MISPISFVKGVVRTPGPPKSAPLGKYLPARSPNTAVRLENAAGVNTSAGRRHQRAVRRLC
jgi:glutamate mutase epsilon subunit